MWKAIARNPYIAMLLTSWKYADQERPRYVLIYTMFGASNIIEACQPLIWGWLINELQQKGSQVIPSMMVYIGLYLAIHVGFWFFHGIARVMERKLAFNISRNYLQELYHKTLHLPVKWHQDNHSGATINRVRKAYDSIKEFFENGFMYINALAKFGFSFIAMLYFSPLFGSIAILLGFFAIFLIIQFDKPFIKALEETNEKEHLVSSTLFDSLSNIITVITLRLEKRMESGLLQKIQDVFPPFRRKIVVNEWKWFYVDSVVALIYCTIAGGYVYQTYVPGQVFLVGGLVTLIGFVERFTSVFHDIAWQYTEIVGFRTNVQTTTNILDAYERWHLPEAPEKLPKNWRSIHIKNLNFQHELDETPTENAYRPGLNHLEITFTRGLKIALIGESGSGKSTLLALLRGLYPPQDGIEIHVDGQQRPHLDLISSHVTLFPQEPEIFENTLAYNITLGLPFSAAEIEHVCDTAHFSEVVQQLPSGLESNIREKGVNLSGGQKQRLALARGVLAARDSDIVLLDEPTSSVDPKTEVLIYEKMFAEFVDKAVISSLHRLHLLTFFDYVYVMKDGSVVDQGTFEYLRHNSPIFQEMWKHQEEAVAS
jgi:ABC-type multidrug transport system fused ATPase/permease subunit